MAIWRFSRVPSGALLWTCLLLGTWLSPRGAQAEGFEVSSLGARANGRGGANFVGGDSPMGMFYNPAQIARLPGHHAAAALHLHFSERCMTRVQVDESTDPPSAGETFPEVCSEGPATVLPQVAATLRPAEGLTIGLGVEVPVAAFRDFHLGDPDTGTLDGDPDGEPTPTRYLLVQEKLLQLFLTAGAAYEVTPQLRLGASFGWGITKLDFTNAAFSRIETSTEIFGFEAPITARADALNRLEGTDAFVPRLNVGAWAKPVEDLPLELGLSYQWTGNVKTDDATLHLLGYNAEADTPIGTLTPELDAEGTVHGVGIDVPQTSRLAFGARYAQELDTPADDVGDRLSTERFDVEADLVLTFGKRVDRFRVDLPDDATLDATATVDVPVLGPMTLPTTVELPDEIALEHRWKTQVGFRLGGDYTVVPGVFGVRAGLSFQSHGVKRGYEQLDFTPFRRTGIHLGATVRIAHRVDASLAYAHIFQRTVENEPADARYRRAATVTDEEDPDAEPTDEDAAIVNAGTITGHTHLLMLELAAHF
ncbi:MAG: OmpP1/FadL family transporter [Myxococcota bacterium]